MVKKFWLVGIVMCISTISFAQETDWGKFSGQVFADYFYNIARDTSFSDFSNVAAEGQQDLQGFILRRAALNYDKDIQKNFLQDSD
jgi:hypothetical protein